MKLAWDARAPLLHHLRGPCLTWTSACSWTGPEGNTSCFCRNPRNQGDRKNRGPPHGTGPLRSSFPWMWNNTMQFLFYFQRKSRKKNVCVRACACVTIYIYATLSDLTLVIRIRSHHGTCRVTVLMAGIKAERRSALNLLWWVVADQVRSFSPQHSPH